MEHISIAYPTWFILLCLLLGATYAFLLYGKNPHFKEKPTLNWILALLRGLSVSMIAFLLLNPIIKKIEEYLKPPIVVVGVDQSTSVEPFSSSLLDKVSELEGQLGDKFTVHMKAIGGSTQSSLSDSFDQTQTDLSDFVERINDEYAHLNLQNVILISDGIFNKGQHPLYVDKKFTAPIQTVLIGDTTLPRDVSIRNIFHNDVAFLNDRFEIEVDVQATNFSSYSGDLILSHYKDGKWSRVESKSLRLNSNDEFKTSSFVVPASQTGVQRYRVSATAISGEENIKNNSRNFFVEILDSRKKITLIKNFTHPDISALKQWASDMDNIELSVVALKDVNDGLLRQSDLVICHQIPAQGTGVPSLFGTLRKLKVPILHFIGEGSDLNANVKVQSSINIFGGGAGSNDIQPIFKRNFDLFEWDDRWNLFENAPPLIGPFAEFSVKGGSQVLAFQKIGRVDTEYPLIAISDRDGRKEAVFTATGIWKWRMTDYYENQQFEVFNDFMNSLVQFISLKENKERFRVKSNKNLFNENETIYFSAELYNSSFENVNDAEVTLSLRSQKGDEYPFTFSRVDKRYALEVRDLPEGNYSYTAETKSGGQSLRQRGQLVIKRVEWEYVNTVAQHSLLRNLSQQSGGKSYAADGWDQLKQDLISQKAKSQVDYQSQSLALIHLKWLLGLIALFLCVEWFLRRYSGRY